TFGPMHVSGMLGMPRRIFTYEVDRGWDFFNQLSTLGALIQVPSYAIFVYNVIVSWRKGRPAGDNPWDAWTLEWATTSPPPAYNFEAIPTVHSRRPLGDLKPPDDPDWRYERREHVCERHHAFCRDPGRPPIAVTAPGRAVAPPHF